jgi:glycosyltransferase involved in cell wall biosynthesis
MKPRISVIIPTLNEERFIARCLKALRNQTFKEFEMIVGDSYSVDRTIKIAKQFKARVRLTQRRGPAAGRNEGAKVARGEILVFIDADTIASQNLLEEVFKAFQDPSIVAGTTKILALEEGLIDRIAFSLYNLLVKILAKLSSRLLCLVGICCFYRKNVFLKEGGFDEKLHLNEDTDLTQRIKRYGKVIFIKNSLVRTSLRRVRRWGYLRFIIFHLMSTVYFQVRGKAMPKKYGWVR